MIAIIWALIGWHLLLAIIALVQRLPRSCFGSGQAGILRRIWLRGRVWPLLAWYDGWIGVFWKRKEKKLFIFLLPFVGVRISFHPSSNPAGLADFLLREIAEQNRAAKLSSAALHQDIIEHVWPLFSGGRPLALLDEALNRLAEFDHSTSGVALIMEERRRGIEVEGFTAEHDDEHVDGELAAAAAAYALPPYPRNRMITFHEGGNGISPGRTSKSQLWERLWPWDSKWWKPSHDDRIRELAIAGALVAAEIDRWQRLKKKLAKAKAQSVDRKAAA